MLLILKILPFDELSKKRYTNDVRCPDPDAAMEMKEAILLARKNGDSLGGTIECITDQLPTWIRRTYFSDQLNLNYQRILFRFQQ